MELTVKWLKPEDYDEILVKWWNDWNWSAPTRDFLPEDGSGGMIVFDGDTPVCAGYIYITNSKVAWVDWIISNKSYREKPNRGLAIELLIRTLTDVAKKSGAEYSYALLKHRGLQKTYLNLGYIESDSYQSEMLKKL